MIDAEDMARAVERFRDFHDVLSQTPPMPEDKEEIPAWVMAQQARREERRQELADGVAAMRRSVDVADDAMPEFWAGMDDLPWQGEYAVGFTEGAYRGLVIGLTAAQLARERAGA